MATIYSSDVDGGGNPSLEDVLLRHYHTSDILTYPLSDGLEMYMRSLKREREDRLYLLWVAYYTNPFAGKDRKTWEEFLGETKVTNAPASKYGKITGVDLAQRK